MVGQAYELGPALHGPIHKLRRTHKGIRYLQQTGQFKEYMQVWLDSRTKPFISWDGEGWTDVDGEHRYMLLQSSTGAYIDAPRLGSAECLNLILKVAGENPKTVHVIFGGGYDATHILRDLPLEMVAGLKDNEPVFWAVPKTEDHEQNIYKINYLPHKWLEITGFDYSSHKYVHVKIFDVMTFFQSSFISALKSRQIEVPEVIATGKATRNTFTYQDIEEIKIYCQQELELLVLLCNKLRGEFDEAGIYVTQFHGPGAVAKAIFKEHGIAAHKSDTRPEIERASQHAYFGGHFEQYKAGHYDGKVYLYDINSAYPYHIQNLPSLDGVEWEYTSHYEPGEIGVWFCSYEDYDRDFIKPHPLPWRGNGGLVGFPAMNKGVWVWHPEAVYATEVHYGYVMKVRNKTKPFAFVNDMYETRRKWKAEKKGGERALKLGLNSLYGSMAQRVGAKDGQRPAWHQLEWAGMVTSGTRAQMMEAVKLAGDSVIAVETDSIMTTKPLALDMGEALGQWEYKEYDWVTYIQSGIYFTSDTATGTKSKTRGIDVTQLHHAEVLRFLDSDQSVPLQINTRQFIGLNNPRTHLYGQWQDGVKDVKVAGAKRIHSKGFCGACKRGESMATNLHTLIAAPFYGHEPSEPHPLPWVEGGVIRDEPEMHTADSAIEEFDLARRIQ